MNDLLLIFLDVSLVSAAKYVLYMMPNPKNIKKAQHIPYLASKLTFKVTYKGKKIKIFK